MEKIQIKPKAQFAYAIVLMSLGVICPELAIASEADLDAATGPVGTLADDVYDFVTGDIATLGGIGLATIAGVTMVSQGLNRQVIMGPLGGLFAIGALGPIALNLLGSATI